MKKLLNTVGHRDRAPYLHATACWRSYFLTCRQSSCPFCSNWVVFHRVFFCVCSLWCQPAEADGHPLLICFWSSSFSLMCMLGFFIKFLANFLQIQNWQTLKVRAFPSQIYTSTHQLRILLPTRFTLSRKALKTPSFRNSYPCAQSQR